MFTEVREAPLPLLAARRRGRSRCVDGGFGMNPLYRQATLQGILGTFLFIALVFWPAGTFHYWQGWLFLATFATSTVAFTVYLAIYDKPLLERRLKAGPQHETERSQKIIVSLVFVAFFALIILPALDHRFGWSPVAPWVSVLGDVIIVLTVSQPPIFAWSKASRSSKLVRMHTCAIRCTRARFGCLSLYRWRSARGGGLASSCRFCPCSCGGFSTRRKS
jgi:hypothetical protein